MAGFMDKFFDFNHDGTLSGMEKAAQWEVVEQLLGTEDEADEEYEDDADDERDMQDFELEMAGLDAEELEYMDEEERSEMLEDAGLDPDDFDF